MIYKVASGDTLSEIAKRHGVSTKRLQDFNGIRNINRIYVNQKIEIPGENIKSLVKDKKTENPQETTLKTDKYESTKPSENNKQSDGFAKYEPPNLDGNGLKSEDKSNRKNVKRLAILAGHGHRQNEKTGKWRFDPGTSTRYKGRTVTENEVNKRYAEAVKALDSKYENVEVMIVDRGSYEQRLSKAKDWGADYLIDIQANALAQHNRAQGTLTLYDRDNKKDAKFSDDIGDMTSVALNTRRRTDIDGSGLIVHGSDNSQNMIKTTVELGFMDNKSDIAKLMDPNADERFAKGVMNLIKNYA